LSETVSIVISAFLSTIIFIAGLLIGSWQNKILIREGAKKLLQILKLQNKPNFEYLDYDVKKGELVYMNKIESTTDKQD